MLDSVRELLTAPTWLVSLQHSQKTTTANTANMDLIAELTQRFTELQTLCKALSSDKRDWQQRSDLLHREIERLRSQVQMLERGTSSGDDQVVKDVIAAFEDDYEKLCEVNAVLRKTNEGLEAKATAYERQVNALLDEKQALKESFAKEREVLHQELKDLKKVALEAHEDTTELLRLTPVIERCREYSTRIRPVTY